MKVATLPVCPGHSAPIEFLTAWVQDRPPVSLVHGPRGGGKSYLAAVATHIDSIRYDRHGTRILGGSLAQSEQVYHALRDFHSIRGVASPCTAITATRATYRTGSEVSVLAASRTSVRGPHVATLRLDEVDEIDPDIREAAFGMCMRLHGVPASVSLTSTWHRVGGPMSDLVDRGRAGEFPTFSFCAFEVLERCPEERSGPDLENCPACPIVKWCHDGGPVPKAKRADGHYAIDSLIQKTQALSLRVFESDYLCLGPRAAGLWFVNFSTANVTEKAEYDPRLPVHLAIDSGVFTGAVFFQVREVLSGRWEAVVFAEYLVEGQTAETAAKSLVSLSEQRCQGQIHVISTDPAGSARNAVGPAVVAEYERVFGRGRVRHWPIRPVADSLALLESFVSAADGTRGLSIHPRCKALIRAFENYRRAKRQSQWQDYPEDPNHPHEDLIDALRGGLGERFPEGRKPEPKLRKVHAATI